MSQTVRDPKLYIKEIIEHTGYIEEYTKGLTYAQFKDKKTFTISTSAET